LILEKLFQRIDVIKFPAKALEPILSSKSSETKFNSVSWFLRKAAEPIDLILLSRSRFNFFGLITPKLNAELPIYSRFVKCDKSQGKGASPVFATGDSIF
jgi:hypothetical protein